MKYFTLLLLALFMSGRAEVVRADQLPDAEQKYLLRLSILALPFSVRAMCDDAPEPVRAKLEARLKSLALDNLGADYLCRDDLCTQVSGAAEGAPDMAQLSEMISRFRNDQVEVQKHLSKAQRLKDCTKFMSLLERVKSSDPEKIMLEMQAIAEADNK